MIVGLSIAAGLLLLIIVLLIRALLSSLEVAQWCNKIISEIVHINRLNVPEETKQQLFLEFIELLTDDGIRKLMEYDFKSEYDWLDEI